MITYNFTHVVRTAYQHFLQKIINHTLHKCRHITNNRCDSKKKTTIPHKFSSKLQFFSLDVVLLYTNVALELVSKTIDKSRKII